MLKSQISTTALAVDNKKCAELILLALVTIQNVLLCLYFIHFADISELPLPFTLRRKIEGKG